LHEEVSGTAAGALFSKGTYKNALKSQTLPIVVNGTPAPKGLFMRPSLQGPILVTYRLDRQFKTFRATTALADGSGGTEQVFFKVICDGQEKWKSREFKQPRNVDECNLSVNGVEKLELTVSGRGAHFPEGIAVWVDPRLEPSSRAPLLWAIGIGLLAGALVLAMGARFGRGHFATNSSAS
jgi:hypothetical protein